MSDTNYTMLNSTDVAEIFNVSTGTIYRWRDRGILKVDGTTPSGRALFSSQQIEALRKQYYGEKA